MRDDEPGAQGPDSGDAPRPAGPPRR
ncbi:hypothetical protein GA0115237_10435, partial [Streptomyces sp. ScaeMP-6W]